MVCPVLGTAKAKLKGAARVVEQTGNRKPGSIASPSCCGLRHYTVHPQRKGVIIITPARDWIRKMEAGLGMNDYQHTHPDGNATAGSEGETAN